MTLIAFPRMHAYSESLHVPDDAMRLGGGLPVDDPYPADYPWDAAMASQYRRDILQNAAVLARDREHPMPRFGTDNAVLGKEEADALAAFSHGEDNSSIPCSEASASAQSALIIAYVQEEQCHELSLLGGKISGESSMLSDLISNAEEADLTGEGMPKQNFSELGYVELPNWRSLLGPFLRFLPEDAILCLNDKNTADEIRELPEAASASSPDGRIRISSKAILPRFKPERAITFLIDERS